MTGKGNRLMKKLFAAALIASLASQAGAQQMICDFSSWRGASSKIGKSWTGEKVLIDPRRNLIQRGFSNGWYKAQPITSITKSHNFLTYVTRSQERDSRGQSYYVSMSFRVYTDGKGTARINAGSRVQDIMASGRCASE
ncbi:hypothetical protein MWU54_04125 [Marivita sp. S6314]|uniref:hypothetical protein n=1 Tax=Marivita sp. S6314 TaxID=2926406 RepID=UPI001FF6A483|nr:hypothetical protein [Marivita sp. S6314]MCK0149196.1 hypothetical protein [Marivita sp. S6314]